MTQGERDELQRYLDERIFGTKRQMRSICANKQLTQIQKDSLYQVVKDIRDIKDFTSEKNTQRLDNALVVVANCLQQINFHGMKPNPKNSKNIVPRDKMPFLVKQVLWLICYKSLQAGLKQKDVFSVFVEHNIYVSHNFFSSLEQTPDYFLRCEEYSQPENPCKYKGQKKNELAVAIKNLVYQAGKHSCFVDIFGGSGSASAAVCRKKRVKYVYNEKNEAVYNYIREISGIDYEKIIVGLCSIQDDLLSLDVKSSAYMKFDFHEEIGNYISVKQDNFKRKSDVVDWEKEIQRYVKFNFQIDKQGLENLMKQFPTEIQVCKNEIKKLLEEKKIFEGISSFQELEKMNTVDDFRKFENDFYYLSLSYLPTWRLSYVKGMYNSEEITYDMWRRMIRQYKALGYYAYFYLLRKKTGNNVACAIGEIFLWYFSVQGSIVSSAIIYDCRSTVWHDPYYAIYNFIHEDFANKVRKFHDVLSGTVMENKDFKDIIQDYSAENTLFYSDPPYVDTSDYSDEVRGVSEFSEFDMKDLIEKLMNCVEDNNCKFIFSMRAVKSKDQGKCNLNDIKRGNEAICKNVYNNFLNAKNKNTLYVLVIYKTGKDLRKLIQESRVIEVMITSYKIVSFEAKSKTKNKSYTYEAFTFDNYLALIRKNMVGYQKSWGL